MFPIQRKVATQPKKMSNQDINDYNLVKLQE
jgi:hypothetical protein